MPIEKVYDTFSSAYHAEVRWTKGGDRVTVSALQWEEDGSDLRNFVEVQFGEGQLDRLISVLKRVRRQMRSTDDIDGPVLFTVDAPGGPYEVRTQDGGAAIAKAVNHYNRLHQKR